MSKRNQPYQPLSLAQHFEAPDDYYGRFGWMCGYSADAAFMDDAAERFTRRTHAQRAYMGHPALALMLDPSNPNVSLINAPAVAHLPIKKVRTKPFRLLHAKIALLYFCSEKNTDKWQLRLIVSTGNWTRETIESSLDLAWRVDLSKEDFENPDDEVRQVCADMKAAWDFLKWLRDYFDTGLLDARPPGKDYSESTNAKDFFDNVINKVPGMKQLPDPRFFDNREESLLEQLPAMIKATGDKAKRNYLAMGSGFYEAPARGDKIPSVLGKIVKDLISRNLLTATAEKDVFVNPNACQGVAASHEALVNEGYSVRLPGKPVFMGPETRFLHAKFLFSANYRENSKACNSAWLYLGSGNLTGPGFNNRMSASGGNLEAGIVFAPKELYWYADKPIKPAQIVTNLIPIQWDDENLALAGTLSEGTGMEDRDTQFIAAPVPWLLWSQDETNRWLKAPEGTATAFDVLDGTGKACFLDDKKRYLWMEDRPRQVRICWANEGQVQQSLVPILDEFGRLAAVDLPQLDLEEAWWQLANFPSLPEGDESEPSDPDPHKPKNRKKRSSSKPSDYPIRKMMELIENIAAKQTVLSPVDWPAWCARLEQSLTQAANCPMVDAFSRLELNPLSPLWHAPFRPTFAETAETPEGQCYEGVLHEIEEKWNVGSLRKIGENYETNI